MAQWDRHVFICCPKRQPRVYPDVLSL